MFRGREMAHPERGEMILNRLAEDLGELAVVEQRPQQDGRNMTMMLGPAKAATAAEEARPRARSPRLRRARSRPLAEKPAAAAVESRRRTRPRARGRCEREARRRGQLAEPGEQDRDRQAAAEHRRLAHERHQVAERGSAAAAAAEARAAR